MVIDKLDSYREDIRFQLPEYSLRTVVLVMIKYYEQEPFPAC